MTAENDQPVYTRAARAPWQEILLHRWSGRRDRALVLRDRNGLYHLPGNRRRRDVLPVEDLATGPAEQGAGIRAGLLGYDGAFLVHLDERPGTRAVAFPTSYGTESVDVQVLWWVHDAAQVVRTRTTHGWFPVRKDLDRRLRRLRDEYARAGHSLGAPELVQHLTAPHQLHDCGLTYRVTDVSARENDTELRLGEPGGTGLPYSWSDRSREEYDFCRRAVQEGPVSLAALWLVRHPDQVSEVLNWAVDHSGLIRGTTTWQDEMAGLLGRLTAQEQQELSQLMRDRLVALGRQVPGQQGPGVSWEKARSQANGWAGGVANGRPR
ncbi:hypothetical protein [Kitasatospora sp. HPMI-4]|uniref:hypothetical protein n=1 Tax=Kitasatospora sp. HPMI-4 TaxID=3448443 RepID=UPI003F1C18D6